MNHTQDGEVVQKGNDEAVRPLFIDGAAFQQRGEVHPPHAANLKTVQSLAGDGEVAHSRAKVPQPRVDKRAVYQKEPRPGKIWRRGTAAVGTDGAKVPRPGTVGPKVLWSGAGCAKVPWPGKICREVPQPRFVDREVLRHRTVGREKMLPVKVGRKVP